MTETISEEIIQTIRSEVRDGKTKKEVAREYGLHYETVKKYTKGIQNGKIYSLGEEREIREMVKEVGVKSIVARELDVPYGAVKRIAREIKLKPGNRTIGGKTLQLLEEIMSKGYAMLENRLTPNYRILKKHFPVIQKVHAKGKTIVFLPDKKEEAVRYFLENMRYRVMSYHELKPITRLFGVNLSPGEKQKLIGRSQQSKTPETQRTLDEFCTVVRG